MATDIAFAIGVMALLGDRVSLGLKVFLTALAIVDDIAAVLVIAVFYTANLAWGALGVAASCLLLALAANRLGLRHPLPYALIGVVLWMTVRAVKYAALSSHLALMLWCLPVVAADSPALRGLTGETGA
jgi:NhaA family Na+:H+ antiporter